jgi:uncharacterized protein YceK
MRMTKSGFVLVMSGCITVVSLIGCGSSTPPGIASVQLTAVDGKPLPVVIASTTSDQTLVMGGNAVLGEAIATGSYALSLRHATGATSQTSDISGTTNFVANGSRVTATIDLGVALGQHVYTFGF